MTLMEARSVSRSFDRPTHGIIQENGERTGGILALEPPGDGRDDTSEKIRTCPDFLVRSKWFWDLVCLLQRVNCCT